MLVGYVRVSKSDGSQTLAPQRDAMTAAGVEPDRIYEDLASGRRDDRPGKVPVRPLFRRISRFPSGGCRPRRKAVRAKRKVLWRKAPVFLPAWR